MGLLFSRREFIQSGVASVALFSCGNGAIAQPRAPHQLDIAQASQLIRSGKLSPTELTRSYLARISKLDPLLNAFITVTEERALAQARMLESELAQGQWRGPLHGIPIALKDNIDTAGVRTTAGSAVFEDRVPRDDAEVVRRLKKAGAIILGKLNMLEFALGEAYTTARFGAVRNPWDLNRITGGSSSGAGAAVAAHLCAAALGTDTGGSVRIPAAMCGVTGLMPTYGLASVRGIVPFSSTKDHVGPLCRTVGDAALILQAIAGHDPLDIASIETIIPEYKAALGRSVRGLRLGVPRAVFFDDVDEEILTAVEVAIHQLSTLTSGASDVELPPFPGFVVGLAEVYEYHKSLIEEKRDLYGKSTLNLILRGAQFSTTEYIAARREMAHARRAIAKVFDHVDLLITPTVSKLPVPIDVAQANPQQRALIRNTIQFNNFGIPAITIPCGFSRGGLPIGLQICGPALGELDMLALAHAYQMSTNWHTRLPPLG